MQSESDSAKLGQKRGETMSDIKTEPTPDQAREAKREQLERAGEKNLDVNPRNGEEGLKPSRRTNHESSEPERIGSDK